MTQFDRAQNMTWSTAGYSEILLKRKLQSVGLSMNERVPGKHVGTSSFFTFLVRMPLSFICGYTDPANLIGWVRRTQSANEGIAHGCYAMWKDMARLSESPSTMMVPRKMLEMSPCSANPNDVYQLFRVQEVRGDSDSLKPQATAEEMVEEVDTSEAGMGMPFSLATDGHIVIIKWVGENEQLCVSLKATPPVPPGFSRKAAIVRAARANNFSTVIYSTNGGLLAKLASGYAEPKRTTIWGSSVAMLAPCYRARRKAGAAGGTSKAATAAAVGGPVAGAGTGRLSQSAIFMLEKSVIKARTE